MNIKSKILRFFSHTYIFRMRMKGIDVPFNCMINKMPYIRKRKGSSIILGNNVTLTSNGRHNPMTMHPVGLRTLTPDAVIEFKDNSGVSGANIVCSNRITIGEHTIIGADTLIYDSDGHTYTPERGWNTPRLMSGRPISIGKKCFIGTRCIILGGVTIGDNCILSAGSVVTQNIPSGHKAYGNPAIIVPLPQSLGGSKKESSIKVNHAVQAVISEDTNLTEKESAFLTAIQESLELDIPIKMEDHFREYETWDSIAFLTLAAYLSDNYSITLTSDNYNQIKTWRDVYNMLPTS